jgi:hypothetical protein
MTERDSRPSRVAGPPGPSRRARQEDSAGDEGVPGHLRRFIGRHFVSGAQVEVLLLLRAGRDWTWTARDVSRELRIDADQAEHILKRCVRSGLVRNLDDRYRYSPRTATGSAEVDALAHLYPLYRLAIISIIYSQPTAPIRDFSDAFNLRAPTER